MSGSNARRIRTWAATLVAVIGAATMAKADMFYVNATCGNDNWTGTSSVCLAPNGPKRTIQAGIDAADPGDTVLVADGLYVGRNNYNLNFRGKSITVRSVSGPGQTTIDAQRASSSSGFVFQGAETPEAVVEGFTITGATLSGIRVTNGAAPTIRDCALIANWSGLVGGGVNVDSRGEITLIDCVLDRNLSGQGGGINVWENARATLIRCTISRNRVDITGGAAAMADRDSILILESCIISDNESIGFAGSSAGVRIARGSFGSLFNCLFYGNQATGSGAGISITNDGAGEVINCTVSRNQAAGVGAGLLVTEGVGDVVVLNTTFWENVPDQISQQGGDLSVTYSDIEGSWPGEGNISLDPQFVAPFNGDFRLGVQSPAIDTGDPAYDPPGGVDLDGNRRVWNHRVDIGAYEFGSFPHGDMNCDGDINALDIEDFIDLLFNGGEPCNTCTGDTNADGNINALDIEPFLECLFP
ncbi:MAG: right-handed parallel beta-helix repeat-containing protein [Planctomycetes bacterium]|nr:right-handed parallel beta-helix repeat-containing protein [Planctomycetota bacterium]